MSDANDENNRSGRAPLTLKPRGQVSAGTVRQSFSHGRTKTVVVETKRRRVDAPTPERPRAQGFEVKRAPAPGAPTPAPAPREATPPGGLSAEEMEARRRVIAQAQAETDRRAAEQRARDDARRAEEDARRRSEAAVARAAEEAARPKAEPEAAPAPAPAAPRPAAAAPPAAAPVAPTPAPVRAPEPVEDRPQPSYGQRAPREDRPAPAPRPVREERPAAAAPAGGFGRPREERAGYGQAARDAARGAPAGGYSARSPSPGFGQSSREGPRPGAGGPGGGGFGARGPRPEGGAGGMGRGPRPEGQAGFGRGPRPEGQAGFGRGPRQESGDAGGGTVRYSALSPRPAGARPSGPRPAGAGYRPGAPAAPSGPEFTRPSRAPGGGLGRPGLRRPGEDDDRRGGAPKGALSRQRGAPERRQGRLTIQAVAGDEDTAERMRSLASVRRAREREREKRRGGAADTGQVTREVIIPDVITVQDLSQRMAVRAADVIKFLMRQGMMAKITDVLDADTAELIATDLGHTVRRVSEADVEEGFLASEDVESDTQPRPPVVAVMGHVDHGKTSLLDALRSTDVTRGEAGGITQHIGAYQVRLEDGQRVTFLDTPGHAAFSAMRARGADVTDIVVLVVAADDGVMPQTVEALNHAKASGAPIIVAINKIDKPDADPTRVVNELLQYEIVAESLGGDTQMVQVSATQKLGLDDLVEAILVQAEVMDLRANPDRTAEGTVIEAKLDKGRGPVATVLVNRGTLKRGDIVVAGSAWGKVRALVNERGEQVQSAGPSEPVEILGLDEPPSPGDLIAVVDDEARARELTDYRERVRREKNVVPVGGGASLAEMMAKLQDKQTRELPVVIKSDVQGSAEAIQGSLTAMGTDEVRARVIHTGVGGITESDVSLAKASGAPIVAFNVRASKQARDQAERDGVEIRYYSIIYDLLDDIKGVLSGMLPPAQRENFLGYAQVLEVFDITKVGKVAGCRVTEGVVRRGARVRIVRENVVVLELGVLQSLRRFKDDVQEVGNGVECGMTFQGFQDIRVNDQIECFTVEQVARTLD